MWIRIDPATGVHGEGGELVGKGDAPERVAEVLACSHEYMGQTSVVSGDVTLGDRSFHLEGRFRSEKLTSIQLSTYSKGDWLGFYTAGQQFEKEIESTRRERAFLASLLGPPGYENERGSLYSYSWGFVYAGVRISIIYPGHRAPVPLPRKSPGGWPFFRCVGCGHLMDLGYGSHVLEVPRDRGGAPCEACGSIAWVQAGSTTEFYKYSQKPWVCEVGMHPAEGVKLFRIFPPASSSSAPKAEPGKLRIESFLVKACPAHVADLRRGFLGCVLPEGAEGEDPK